MTKGFDTTRLQVPTAFSAGKTHAAGPFPPYPSTLWKKIAQAPTCSAATHMVREASVGLPDVADAVAPVHEVDQHLHRRKQVVEPVAALRHPCAAHRHKRSQTPAHQLEEVID